MLVDRVALNEDQETLLLAKKPVTVWKRLFKSIQDTYAQTTCDDIGKEDEDDEGIEEQIAELEHAQIAFKTPKRRRGNALTEMAMKTQAVTLPKRMKLVCFGDKLLSKSDESKTR